MSSLVSGHCLRVGQLRHIAEDVLSLQPNHPGTVQQIWNNTPRSVVSHHTHLDSLEQHPTVCHQPSHSLRFTGTTPHGLSSAITLTQIHWNNTPRSVVSHHTHSDSLEQHPTVCRQPSHSLRFTGTTPHSLSSAITLTQIHWNNTPRSVVSHHTHSDSLEQHPTVCRQPSHSLRFTGTTPHGLSSAITLTQIHWNNTPRSVVSHHTHSDSLEQHPTVCRQPSHSLRFIGTTPHSLSSAITLTQIHCKLHIQLNNTLCNTNETHNHYNYNNYNIYIVV